MRVYNEYQTASMKKMRIKFFNAIQFYWIRKKKFKNFLGEYKIWFFFFSDKTSEKRVRYRYIKLYRRPTLMCVRNMPARSRVLLGTKGGSNSLHSHATDYLNALLVKTVRVVCGRSFAADKHACRTRRTLSIIAAVRYEPPAWPSRSECAASTTTAVSRNGNVKWNVIIVSAAVLSCFGFTRIK